MRIVRPTIRVAPFKHIGKAAALLAVARSEAPATFILTHSCPLRCKHCYAPQGNTTLPADLAMDTIDELKGHPGPVYFAGGEPLLHPQVKELAAYASAKVGNIHIDTNGFYLPDESKAAGSFIGEFPTGTVFVLSFDDYHAQALEKVGKNISTILFNMHAACQQNGMGFKLNIRSGPNNQRYSRLLQKFLKGPGEEVEVFENSVIAQNVAQTLDASETIPVGLADFLDHIRKVDSIGIFVNPRGQVISGDHSAYLGAPPSFAVMGDLNQHTLAHILWHKFLPGKTFEFARTYNLRNHDIRGMIIKNNPGLEVNDLGLRTTVSLILREENKTVSFESLCEWLRTDPPLDYEIDLNPDLRGKLLLALFNRQIPAAVQASAKQAADMMADEKIEVYYYQGDKGEWGILKELRISFLVRRKTLSLRASYELNCKIHHDSRIYNSDLSALAREFVVRLHADNLSFLSAQEFEEYFLAPLAKGLNKSEIKNKNLAAFVEALLQEIEAGFPDLVQANLT